MADILDSIDEALLRRSISKQNISDLYSQLESSVEPAIPTESMITLLRLNQRAMLLKSEIEALTRATTKSEHETQQTKLENGLVLPSEAVGLKVSWDEKRARRKTLKPAWYSVLADSEAPALLVAEPFALELESQADTLEAAIEALIEVWPIEASAGSAPTILRLCATLVREGAAGTYVAPDKRVWWLDFADFEDLLEPA